MSSCRNHGRKMRRRRRKILLGDGHRDEILGAPEHGPSEGRALQQHVLPDVGELLQLAARIPLETPGNGLQGDAQGLVTKNSLPILILAQHLDGFRGGFQLFVAGQAWVRRAGI